MKRFFIVALFFFFFSCLENTSAQSVIFKGKAKKRDFHYSGVVHEDHDSLSIDGVYIRSMYDSLKKQQCYEFIRFFKKGRVFISEPICGHSPEKAELEDLKNGTCTYYHNDSDGVYVKRWDKKRKYYSNIARFDLSHFTFVGYRFCRHCKFYKEKKPTYLFMKINLSSQPGW